MTWFAAHALVAARRADSVGPINVYENVFLVNAESAEQAKALAVDMAMAEVNVSDGLTVDGVPAARTFVGIRKVVAVSNPDPLDLDGDRPISGTELTYSGFEVDSEEALAALASGDLVVVRYVD